MNPLTTQYDRPGSAKRESKIDRLTAAELAEVEKFRAIITTALTEASQLNLRFWAPVGYEMSDVVDTLRQFMPGTRPEIERQMADAVADHVDNGVLFGEFA